MHLVVIAESFFATMAIKRSSPKDLFLLKNLSSNASNRVLYSPHYIAKIAQSYTLNNWSENSLGYITKNAAC